MPKFEERTNYYNIQFLTGTTGIRYILHIIILIIISVSNSYHIHLISQ